MFTTEKSAKTRVASESLLPRTAERLEFELKAFQERLALRHKALLQFKNKDADVQYEVVIWSSLFDEVKSIRGNDLQRCLEEAKKVSSVRSLYVFENIGEISISLHPEDPIFRGFNVTQLKEKTIDGTNPQIVWTVNDRGNRNLSPAKWGKAIDI